jgi:hypothetical protein
LVVIPRAVRVLPRERMGWGKRKVCCSATGGRSPSREETL